MGTLDGTPRGGRADLGTMYCLGCGNVRAPWGSKQVQPPAPLLPGRQVGGVPATLSPGAVSAMHGKEQPARLCLLFTFAAPGISHIDPSQ